MWPGPEGRWHSRPGGRAGSPEAGRRPPAGRVQVGRPLAGTAGAGTALPRQMVGSARVVESVALPCRVVESVALPCRVVESVALPRQVVESVALPARSGGPHGPATPVAGCSAGRGARGQGGRSAVGRSPGHSRRPWTPKRPRHHARPHPAPENDAMTRSTCGFRALGVADGRRVCLTE